MGGPGSTVTRSLAILAEHRRRVEDRHGIERRAAYQGREPAGLVAERVEERVDGEVAVARAQADRVGPRDVDAHVLLVRAHDALGHARSCPT